MATTTLDKREQEEQLLPDDTNDHLRADVLGSIAGADPNSPGYLGKINSLVTAHGAVDKIASPTMMSSGSMAMPGATPTAIPDSSPPLMGAKPKQGWLGKIGGVARRMGNIAGDVLAPGVMMNLPGTDLNKKFEARQADKKSEKERQLGVEERRVGVEEDKEKREAAAAGQPKPKEEKWEVSKEYTGPNGEPVEVEQNSGTMRIAGSDVPGIKRVEKPEKEVNTIEGVRKDLLSAMQSGDQEKVKTLGEQLEKLSDPTGEKEAMRQLQMEMARQRIKEKNEKNTALTPQAQEILMTSEPVLQQVDQLLTALEPYKKDKKRLTLDRIGYALGNASPEGSLASDISKLELDRVMAGARVLKGSSRAYQALELAMKHAPNTWTDTTNLMYDKLTNIRQNLSDVIEDAKKFGVKNLSPTTKTGTEKTGGKIASEPLSLDEAKEYLQKAGGDKKKARELAKKDGRKF